MECLIIIIILSLMLIILAFIYDVNIKKLKIFGKQEEAKLNCLVDKYPSNLEICKYILKKIDNSNVKVEEDVNCNTCLYIAITNKIIIANVRNSYTRIQTIAHECLHSCQDRKILLFNFIYSNIYILYFLTITVLAVVKLITNNMFFITIMLILSYIYYFVRSYLEDDAMTKARYLAKEYMEEMKISKQEEIDKIIISYDKLNNMGIKMTNYSLMFGTIIKIIIVAIAFLI